MEHTPKPKEPLRKRVLKRAGAWLGAAAVGVTATIGTSYLPPRGPYEGQDCKGKVDGITKIENEWNDRYQRFRVSKVTGKMACANVYLDMNRTTDHDGSALRDELVEFGDDMSVCYDDEHPGQLQIEGRKRVTPYYVKITKELDKEIRQDVVPVPDCAPPEFELPRKQFSE